MKSHISGEPAPHQRQQHHGNDAKRDQSAGLHTHSIANLLAFQSFASSAPLEMVRPTKDKTRNTLEKHSSWAKAGLQKWLGQWGACNL